MSYTISIIIFISILLFCNTSTEDLTFLYKDFKFGQSTTFRFIRGYKTFILKGSINKTKEISFSIKCKPLIDQIKYLFTNIDYNTEDEMISLIYEFPKVERSKDYFSDEYIFTAKTEGEYQNFYLGITLSEIPNYSIDIKVKSSFYDFTTILIVVGLIFIILICARICKDYKGDPAKALLCVFYCFICCFSK